MAGILEALVGGIQGGAMALSTAAYDQMKSNALDVRDRNRSRLEGLREAASDKRRQTGAMAQIKEKSVLESESLTQRAGIAEKKATAKAGAKLVSDAQVLESTQKTKIATAERVANIKAENAVKLKKIAVSSATEIAKINNKYDGQKLKLETHKARSRAVARYLDVLKSSIEFGDLTRFEANKEAQALADADFGIEKKEVVLEPEPTDLPQDTIDAINENLASRGKPLRGEGKKKVLKEPTPEPANIESEIKKKYPNAFEAAGEWYTYKDDKLFKLTITQ